MNTDQKNEMIEPSQFLINEETGQYQGSSGMYLDGYGISHSAPWCEHVGKFFKCTGGCGRKICWCAGHDGAGTKKCRRNCSKCDECCPNDL